MSPLNVFFFPYSFCTSKKNVAVGDLTVHTSSVSLRLTASPSVTPQKYEPSAMDFWLVERMHASAASRNKGGFKRRRSLPQHRAAYEVAAAPRWDDCQAKAVIGAGAQMKSSHFVGTGGFHKGDATLRPPLACSFGSFSCTSKKMNAPRQKKMAVGDT